MEDIIDLEEKVELDVALNAYFKDLRGLVKKEKWRIFIFTKTYYLVILCFII